MNNETYWKEQKGIVKTYRSVKECRDRLKKRKRKEEKGIRKDTWAKIAWESRRNEKFLQEWKKKEVLFWFVTGFFLKDFEKSS